MNIYITDDSGRKFWKTSVSAAYAQGERNNLARHLRGIIDGDPAYEKVGIDANSARIVEDLDRLDAPLPDEDDEISAMSDDDLLNALTQE